MKRYDRMSSVAWLFAAIYICLESSRLPLGSWNDPGPGFLPLVVGLLLGILSVVVFLQASLAKGQEPKVSWYPKGRWRKLILVLAALFGYALCLETLGFLFSTFIFLVLIFRGGIERQRWVLALVGSAIASLSSYAIFELWLKVQLPKGILGF